MCHILSSYPVPVYIQHVNGKSDCLYKKDSTKLPKEKTLVYFQVSQNE